MNCASARCRLATGPVSTAKRAPDSRPAAVESSPPRPSRDRHVIGGLEGELRAARRGGAPRRSRPRRGRPARCRAAVFGRSSSSRSMSACSAASFCSTCLTVARRATRPRRASGATSCPFALACPIAFETRIDVRSASASTAICASLRCASSAVNCVEVERVAAAREIGRDALRDRLRSWRMSSMAFGPFPWLRALVPRRLPDAFERLPQLQLEPARHRLVVACAAPAVREVASGPARARPARRGRSGSPCRSRCPASVASAHCAGAAARRACRATSRRPSPR